MMRLFVICFFSLSLSGCISTAPQVNESPAVYTPGTFSQGEDQPNRNPENGTGKQECETVSAEKIRAELLAGINQLRRQGCDCMGKTMPKVKVLKWDGSLENYAVEDAKRAISGEHAYQSEPSTDITQYLYEEVWSFQNEGAKDVARLLIAIQLQSRQCEQVMNKDFTSIGASKQGCYWSVVLQ